MRKTAGTLLIIVLLSSFYLSTPQLAQAGSNTVVVPKDYATIQAAVKNANDGETTLVKAWIFSVHPNRQSRSAAENSNGRRENVRRCPVLEKNISLSGEKRL